MKYCQPYCHVYVFNVSHRLQFSFSTRSADNENRQIIYAVYEKKMSSMLSHMLLNQAHGITWRCTRTEIEPYRSSTRERFDKIIKRKWGMVTTKDKEEFMENSEKVAANNEFFSPLLQQIDGIVIQVSYLFVVMHYTFV